MDEIFTGVFSSGKKILTRNLIPGFRSLSEELVGDYRVWDPRHSKPAAAIAKGLKKFPVKRGSKVLYLGAANGNTVSFLSDIVGAEGVIYSVEVSERSMRDLASLAEKRKNIVPILANAKLPSKYEWIENVDLVVQDVATSDQSEILIRNCSRFLKKGGFVMFSLKSRSIDVTAEPQKIYRQEVRKLEKHFKVLEKLSLDPFEKDHLFLLLQFKPDPKTS